MSSPHKYIRETVRGITARYPDAREIRRFVDLAYRLSSAYIANRRAASQVLGLQHSDLALDLVAELFERDNTGRFRRIRSYYDAVGWRSLDDAGLWSATRRLVLGSVSDSLFRLYRNADPSLAKIIRNVKRAAGLTQNLCVQNTDGRLFVCASRQGWPSSSHLPAWPQEIFGARLSSEVCLSAMLTEVMAGVARVLVGSDLYRPSVPLTMLAQSIRSGAVRLNSPIAHESITVDHLSVEQLSHIIHRCVERQGQMRRSKYVDRKKLTVQEFDSILNAVEDQLAAQFIGGDGMASSNFEALASNMPSLEAGAYRVRYRNILEYVYQCAHSQFITLMKKDLLVSEGVPCGNEL